MRLVRGQMRQFITALLDAFPTQTSLEMMVRIELDKNLGVIAQGKNLKEVAYNLTAAAETQGWLPDLISAAHHSNTGNEKLLTFIRQCKEFSNNREDGDGIHKISLHPYQLPNPCNFDLTHLIEDSLEKVEGKKGLIGLGIPCDLDAFLENYCTRLKNELGRNNVQIQRRLTLKPTNVSVDEAVAIIRRCQQKLQINDVLYPIVIQVSDKNIASMFWDKLQQEFTGSFKNRLILIIGGESASALPDNISMLEPPQFREAHIIRWVQEVVTHLGWPPQTRDAWKQKMVAECSHNNILHMAFVYDHLDYTIQLLQEDLSYEIFLAELEKRSSYCV